MQETNLDSHDEIACSCSSWSAIFCTQLASASTAVAGVDDLLYYLQGVAAHFRIDNNLLLALLPRGLNYFFLSKRYVLFFAFSKLRDWRANCFLRAA